MNNTESIKRMSLASHRAGVREAFTLIRNAPNLSHAQLLVKGLLARLETDYKELKDTDDCVQQTSIEVVADLQKALESCEPKLEVRVSSPASYERIERVTIERDEGAGDIVMIEVGYDSLS